MRSLTRSEPHHFTAFLTAAEELARFNRNWAANSLGKPVSKLAECRPRARIVGRLSLARS